MGPNLGRPTKVGSYPPNGWGLFDVHGNVLEWTKDWYRADYGAPGDGMGSRVVRGGFWQLGANGVRAARRMPVEPNVKGSGLGFRVVLRALDEPGRPVGKRRSQ